MEVDVVGERGSFVWSYNMHCVTTGWLCRPSTNMIVISEDFDRLNVRGVQMLCNWCAAEHDSRARQNFRVHPSSVCLPWVHFQ